MSHAGRAAAWERVRGQFGIGLFRAFTALLVLVMFATSSRSLFLPRFSARLQESRRPRPPRHLISTSTRELAGGRVRSQALDRSGPGIGNPAEETAWSQLPVHPIPSRQAYDELTRPDSRGTAGASLPGSQTSPPA